MLDEIKKIMRANDICVLATTGDSGPHTSLMAYVCSTACDEIYVVTPRQTQKYRNISAGEKVSVLMDTRLNDPRDRVRALTITGRAEEVSNEEDKEAIRQAFISGHPQIGELLQQSDIACIRIRIDSFQLLRNAQDSHFIRLRS